MGRNPNSITDYVIAFLVADQQWNTELYNPVTHRWCETDIPAECLMPQQLAQTVVVQCIPTWFRYGGRTVADAEKDNAQYMIARLPLHTVINSRFSTGAWTANIRPLLAELGYSGPSRKYFYKGDLLPPYTYEDVRKCRMSGVF